MCEECEECKEFKECEGVFYLCVSISAILSKGMKCIIIKHVNNLFTSLLHIIFSLYIYIR